MNDRKPLTPNQNVARRLKIARENRGLTQETLGRRLARFGLPWSKATVNAAERSAETDRVREFTADELVAFSLALGVPVAWFLVPASERLLMPGTRRPVPAGSYLQQTFGTGGEELELALFGSLGDTDETELPDTDDELVASDWPEQLEGIQERIDELRQAIEHARASAKVGKRLAAAYRRGARRE